MADLTAPMVFALDDAMQAGGRLVRYVGGYWAPADATRDQNGVPHPHHGTTTIQALVARGHMKYGDWKQGRGASFPTSAEVVP